MKHVGMAIYYVFVAPHSRLLQHSYYSDEISEIILHFIHQDGFEIN